MPLTAGSRLGAYEILTLLGAGGMGEVYKARDTRLDRTVAIKVLSTHLAHEPDLKQRFEREARTIAALNHPHICTLHDIGSEDGIDFLVMEFLEGETLAERLARGPLPLAQALRFAVEIADAIGKAHRLGVTHRDLKPANIMLTKSGTKLLDFGLAKTTVVGANVGSPGQPPQASALPTQAAPLTAHGTILGTFQYMAPEQLEGKDADARTDIFAFGVVLYEMVTGQRAFEAKSHASLIAAILDRDPPSISSLQPMTPRHLDHLVMRCLAKAPDDRWQAASDVQRELQWIADAPAEGVRKEPQAAQRSERRAIPLTVAISLAVVIGVLAATATWRLTRTAPQRATTARVTIPLPRGDRIGDGDNPGLVLSADGTQIAYAGLRGNTLQLYVRAIDSFESRPLVGSEGATNPFFSPDGQWIGFFAQGKLKKIPATGGAVQILCDAPDARGGSWAADETIYFAPVNLSGIWKVPAAGGAPAEITKLDRGNGEVSHRWPQALPGGKAVLFSVWTGPGLDERSVHAQSLDTGARHLVVRGGESGRYVSTGHVVYSRTDDLLAAPFDLARLEPTTTAHVRLIEQVRSQGEGADFAVSDTGTLVYVPGDPKRFERRLVWVDRQGHVEPLPAPLRAYYEASISPDGSRIAAAILGPTIGLWIYDTRRTTLSPLTSNGSSQAPFWTPDGSRLVYRGTRQGYRNLFWRVVDGTGDEERLTTSEYTHTPGSWAPDGKRLAFIAVDPTTGRDIWMLSLDGDRKPQVLVRTPAAEDGPRVSRDGRWLAYVSNESGRPEIYVQPFPGPGRKVQVSTAGGSDAAWSPDGQELFYLSGDKMIAVKIATQPTFAAGPPVLLFEGRFEPSPTGGEGYGVSPDGRRFLRIQSTSPDEPATALNVVLNWFDELKKREKD